VKTASIRFSGLFIVGAAGVVFFALVALLAPVLAPYGISQVVGTPWEGPSANAWLGTDMIGRDLLTRVIWGTRITLLVSGLATLLSFAIGVTFGFVAALKRGWVDQVLSRINDLLMSIPTLILTLTALAVLPKTIGILVSLMAILDASRVFRVSRSIAQDIGVMDYVEIAQLRGEGWFWIVFREIMPNAFAPLLVEAGLRLIFAILFLSTLSFLGLGIQPPVVDWGSLVKENKDGLMFGVFAALIPGTVICIFAVCVNLMVSSIPRNGFHGTGRADVHE
jgi:peptide/nickel transport system permease protein